MAAGVREGPPLGQAEPASPKSLLLFLFFFFQKLLFVILVLKVFLYNFIQVCLRCFFLKFLFCFFFCVSKTFCPNLCSFFCKVFLNVFIKCLFTKISLKNFLLCFFLTFCFPDFVQKSSKINFRYFCYILFEKLIRKFNKSFVQQFLKKMFFFAFFISLARKFLC